MRRRLFAPFFCGDSLSLCPTLLAGVCGERGVLHLVRRTLKSSRVRVEVGASGCAKGALAGACALFAPRFCTQWHACMYLRMARGCAEEGRAPHGAQTIFLGESFVALGRLRAAHVPALCPFLLRTEREKCGHDVGHFRKAVHTKAPRSAVQRRAKREKSISWSMPKGRTFAAFHAPFSACMRSCGIQGSLHT